jgi:tetratricopeptide (TPR) repeat protein
MIQIATKTIRPLAAADTNPNPADRLFLASLLQRQQNTEEAARIYREVGENEAYSSRLRAFALNNLAMIQFETTGEVQPAQLSAATAVELQPRGAYVDTLAYIFEEQGALEQSEKILTENLPRLPNDVKIRLRLIQVWQSLGKLAEADQLLGKVGTILLNSPNPMQLERDRTRELQSRQRQLESLKVDANAMDNSNPQGLSGTELQQVSR